VAWSVLCYNLWLIARLLTDQQKSPKLLDAYPLFLIPKGSPGVSNLWIARRIFALHRYPDRVSPPKSQKEPAGILTCLGARSGDANPHFLTENRF